MQTAKYLLRFFEKLIRLYGCAEKCWEWGELVIEFCKSIPNAIVFYQQLNQERSCFLSVISHKREKSSRPDFYILSQHQNTGACYENAVEGISEQVLKCAEIRLTTRSSKMAASRAIPCHQKQKSPASRASSNRAQLN